MIFDEERGPGRRGGGVARSFCFAGRAPVRLVLELAWDGPNAASRWGAAVVRQCACLTRRGVVRSRRRPAL